MPVCRFALHFGVGWLIRWGGIQAFSGSRDKTLLCVGALHNNSSGCGNGSRPIPMDRGARLLRHLGV